MSNNVFTPSGKITEPSNMNVLWCPFCKWSQTDSFSSRKRFGTHIGNCHPDEVIFPRGTQPPPVVEGCRL